MMDYYAILRVSRNATTQQIKEAYRKIALNSHPDKTGGCTVKMSEFKKASEAYRVLVDEVERKQYDATKGGYTQTQGFNGYAKSYEQRAGKYTGKTSTGSYHNYERHGAYQQSSQYGEGSTSNSWDYSSNSTFGTAMRDGKTRTYTFGSNSTMGGSPLYASFEARYMGDCKEGTTESVREARRFRENVIDRMKRRREIREAKGSQDALNQEAQFELSSSSSSCIVS